MPNSSSPQPDHPSQKSRDEFASAIEGGDVELVRQLLESDPKLANSDLRPVDQRDHFTKGLPLFRACQKQHDAIARLLLEHDADPNASASDAADRPEVGMPLYFAVEARNYSLANFLLDRGSTPDGHPYCSQSTIERVFFQAREVGLKDAIVRRAYAKYLPDREQLESKTVFDLIENQAPDPLKLFARMVDLGGQLPFSAIVREGFHDLCLEVLHHAADEAGTMHDHPNSTVLNNVLGAPRWYGYPKLLSRIMGFMGDRYDYEAAVWTIDVAIGSHNRDGDYQDYRDIIVMQLEYLKTSGQLEKALADPAVKPLHKIASDFTWHSNYGYRAEIAKPECYIDLAELFVVWGFKDINFRDLKTGHSPLSAAVERGHHPGIEVYVEWLLENGADLCESDPPGVNPMAIAIVKGHEKIRQLLEAFQQ